MLKEQKGVQIRPTVDEYFLKIAQVVSERSTCLRHNIGAVLVKDKKILTTGYNGAPAGMPDCLDLGCLRDQNNIDSGTKTEICRAVHAEQNAIIQAARNGVNTSGSTMYITHSPCILCAKMILNAGIERVVCFKYYPDESWVKLFKEANVKLDVLKEPEFDKKQIGERVLVVERNHYEKLGSFVGVKTDNIKKYYDGLLKGVRYEVRKNAEEDLSLKQIIPNFIIKYKDEFFVSKRLSQSDEPRLRDACLLAYGGHINLVDSSEKSGDVIERGVKREIAEELSCNIKSRKLIGFVNDETMEVSKYHFGVIYLVELKSKKCTTKEDSQYKGFWVKRESMGDYFEEADSWSRHMYKELILKNKV